MESRAVLHLTRGMLGKIGLSTAATVRTAFHFGLIFGDVQADFRQVVNLPCQVVNDLHSFPIRSTRARPRERYRLNFIGLVTEFYGFPCMPFLSTRRATALLALAFGLPGGVFTGRLMGSCAVQTEKGFDSPQFSLKLGNPSF